MLFCIVFWRITHSIIEKINVSAAILYNQEFLQNIVQPLVIECSEENINGIREEELFFQDGAGS